jgi:hypothetical protein
MIHAGFSQTSVINFSREGEMVPVNDADTKVSTDQFPWWFAVPEPNVDVLKLTQP